MPFWSRKKTKKSGSLDDLVKVRGRTNLMYTAADFRRPPAKRGTRGWEPKGLARAVLPRTASSDWAGTFDFTGSNRGEFFRWLRDSIPIVAAGVDAWVRLCNTRLELTVEGTRDEIRKGKQVLADLDARLLEMPFGRGSGVEKLTEAYWFELFTTGKFAGELVFDPDSKFIDHFRFVDPCLISWEHGSKGWEPLLNHPEADEPERLNPETFFFDTLSTDLSNPTGREPLACIPFVTEVEQLLLEDMARSSHNAGTPRLQVRITRPPQYDWEGDNEYANRANSYFQDTVREFENLEPDTNIFTWSDVEVAVVGGGTHQWAWRLNREQVIEDVITGLKLYPWVLGRSQRTTQQWVRSQFNLLMQMVANFQKSGVNLVSWICNKELELNGVKARASFCFSDHPDPFRLDKVKADSIEIGNIEKKIDLGIISTDEGARELGYAKASGKIAIDQED